MTFVHVDRGEIPDREVGVGVFKDGTCTNPLTREDLDERIRSIAEDGLSDIITIVGFCRIKALKPGFDNVDLGGGGFEPPIFGRQDQDDRTPFHELSGREERA